MNKIAITFLSFLFCVTLISAQSDKDLINWYHLDPATDHYNGVSEIKTYQELLSNMKSTNVIVAVIDSGVDAEHEDLKSVMWVNLDEIPGNNIDDDKNGYIDDIHGWNFIGGADGKNINGETLEITRLYVKLRKKYQNADISKLNKKETVEYKKYEEYKDLVTNKRSEAKTQLENIITTQKNLKEFVKQLRTYIPGDIFSTAGIAKIDKEDEKGYQISQIGESFIQEWGDSLTFDNLNLAINETFQEGINYYNDKVEYNYNPDYNGRAEIVKDDPENLKDHNYGNNNVEGPDALHGTHVAGIIGAQRGNNIGMDGISNNVSIMSVRAVPNGDERDKDVANAIRYAVDNGASIINMSFGKGHSNNKDIVDKAVRYAEKHDVLLVHAAGNSAQNNDISDNFPNDHYDNVGCLFWKKKKAKNWLEIGALSYKKGNNLIAGFSNYGIAEVDVFSPGMKIYSTIPDDKYKFLQGTSMAAPLVAGMAAVIRSYFPSLTAVQVKDILMKSATKTNEIVEIPGTEGKTSSFQKLSVTGGIVNLYNAVKLAKATKGKKKLKKRKTNA